MRQDFLITPLLYAHLNSKTGFLQANTEPFIEKEKITGKMFLMKTNSSIKILSANNIVRRNLPYGVILP